METSNPYNAPKSKVTGAPSGYGEIKIFTARGRIGRVRYIGYSIGLSMLIAFVLGLISAMMGKAAGSGVAAIVMVASYVGIFIVMMFLTIQPLALKSCARWMVRNIITMKIPT